MMAPKILRLENIDKLLIIPLLFFCLTPEVSVCQQVLNEIKIKRNFGEPRCYYEDAVVNKFKVRLLHNRVLSFVENICGEGSSETFNCNLDIDGDGDNEEYRIAGFTFIPLWDIIGENAKPACHIFQTEGIRMTLVLFEPETSPSPIILAGFGKDSQSLMAALPRQLSRNIDQKYYIDISEQSNDSSAIMEELTQFDTHELSEIQNTREFDFVFLPLKEYLDLATSNRFYFESQIPIIADRGLIIERSLSGLEVMEASTDVNRDFVGLKTYRSLSFRPYPTPVNQDQEPDETDLAYTQGLMCPPDWRDDIVGTHSSIVNGTITQDQTEDLGVGINVGLSDPFAIGNFLFEVDIVYRLNKYSFLQGIFGTYDPINSFDLNTRIFNANLLYRYQFLDTNGFKGFAAGGLGAYVLDSKVEGNFIANLIVGYRLAERLDLEGGGQFQALSSLSNFFSVKLGFKYYFYDDK